MSTATLHKASYFPQINSPCRFLAENCLLQSTGKKLSAVVKKHKPQHCPLVTLHGSTLAHAAVVKAMTLSKRRPSNLTTCNYKTPQPINSEFRIADNTGQISEGARNDHSRPSDSAFTCVEMWDPRALLNIFSQVTRKITHDRANNASSPADLPFVGLVN